MGVNVSSAGSQKRINALIDQQLQKENRNAAYLVKLLLLGKNDF